MPLCPKPLMKLGAINLLHQRHSLAYAFCRLSIRQSSCSIIHESSISARSQHKYFPTLERILTLSPDAVFRSPAAMVLCC